MNSISYHYLLVIHLFFHKLFLILHFNYSLIVSKLILIFVSNLIFVNMMFLNFFSFISLPHHLTLLVMLIILLIYHFLFLSLLKLLLIKEFLKNHFYHKLFLGLNLFFVLIYDFQVINLLINLPNHFNHLITIITYN